MSSSLQELRTIDRYLKTWKTKVQPLVHSTVQARAQSKAQPRAQSRVSIAIYIQVFCIKDNSAD
jgi:hypothetical protein